MLKVSASPFASAAVGLKVYADPAVTVVAGVPEIAGGVLVPPEPPAALDTATLNEGKEVVALPSLTLMMMLAYDPA